MQLKIKHFMFYIKTVMMTLCLCACTAESSSVVENNQPADFIETEEDTENYDESNRDEKYFQKEPIALQYAKGFTLERIDQKYYQLTIGDQKILVIPEQSDIPKWVENDMIVIDQNVSDLYVAASSIPDMIDTLGQLHRVSYTSTTYEDWAISSVKEAMERKDMTYVGKYHAPDYELLLTKGCDLVIESTMIYHSPEVYEKFEQLGIPVIIDYSSYETTPLGRMEWIKAYGAILGCFDEAEKIFMEKAALVDSLSMNQMSEKTVAFFYISSNGSVVVRKPGDYVSKMIEMAGGDYVIQSVPEEDNALSTMNMQMEAFYAEAVDTDILIYNSAIDGEIHTISELTAKSALLKDFKAVKEGKVWCTGKNMFQETGSMAEMIVDLNKVIEEEETDNQKLTYLHYLQGE